MFSKESNTNYFVLRCICNDKNMSTRQLNRMVLDAYTKVKETSIIFIHPSLINLIINDAAASKRKPYYANDAHRLDKGIGMYIITNCKLM